MNPGVKRPKSEWLELVLSITPLKSEGNISDAMAQEFSRLHAQGLSPNDAYVEMWRRIRGINKAAQEGGK